MNKALLIISIVFLVACGESSQKEEQAFQIYDLDQEFEEKELSLSDIMDDPELVALETREESYISDFQEFLVGKKHIIVTDEKRMLLFNRDGSFVKEITNYGRGPGEFTLIISMIFGPDEEKLYFSDYTVPNILSVFNLVSGDYESIKVPQTIESMFLTDSNTIRAFGFKENKSTIFDLNLITLQTSQVELTEGNTSEISIISKVSGRTYVKRSDTIFQYSEDEFIPVESFSVENIADRLQLKSGIRYHVNMVTPSYIILNKSENSYEQTGENNTTVLLGVPVTLCVNRIDQTISILEHLDFEGELDQPPFFQRVRQVNGVIAMRYNAPTWLSIIEANSPHIPSNLIKQSQGLLMEDNPVLLIGKTK